MSDHGNVFEGEVRSGVYGVRVCAVKIACKSEQIVREAKILTKLGSHTHVISIIQSGIYEDAFEDRVFIALDKCHEHNLDQHITFQNESGVKFNLNEALEYSKQIIASVKYVHENLIIHKDLKPSNILLSQDKNTIKLADFGLSQEIKSTSSKVFNKHQFGTDGFRPIESFGDNWASLKSDIFSLGVVLYFVLSNGKSPFGDNFLLLNYNIQNGVIDLSHILVPNMDCFQHLIKLMLSAERCRRPSIWQVADHRCWTGKELECNFDYGFMEEIEDSEIKVLDPGVQNSSDSESEMENGRQLLKALKEMEFNAEMPKSQEFQTFHINGGSFFFPFRGIATGTPSTSLREIVVAQPLHYETAESSKLDSLITKAEQDIQAGLGMEEQSMLQLYDFICGSTELSAEEVSEMGDSSHESKEYVRAIILNEVSSNLSQVQGMKGDEAVKWIGRRIVRITKAATKLLYTSKQEHAGLIKYVLACTEKMFSDLKSQKNENPGTTAPIEAFCFINMAGFAIVAKQYEHSILLCHKGIEVLENQFGERAPQFRYLGHLYNSLALAHKFLGEFSKAEEYYYTAINAKEKAVDYKDEAEKQESIARSNKVLQKVLNRPYA